MSKRLLSSRMAKRSRRIRSSGERLSNPGVRDSQSGPESDTSDSLAPEALASDSSPPGPDDRESVESLPPAAAAGDEGDRASGEVLSSRRPDDVPSSRPSSVPPPAATAASTPAGGSTAAVEATTPFADPERAPVGPKNAGPTASAAGTSNPAEATTVPLSVAAVAAAADKVKKKGKKAKAAVREPDPRADSGALSLNDAVTRSFYDAPILAHGDLDDHHDHDHDVAVPVAMTPELLERKAKLRRIVGGICAAAAVVVVLVAGKTVLDRDDAPTAAPSTNAVTLKSADDTARADAEDAARSRAEADARAAEAKAAADAKLAAEAAKADDAKADDAKADDAKADDAKADDAKAAEGGPKTKEEIAALKKTASKLYNTGKLKDAIPALREAIAADPTDALPYLYLGDALTNTGKWPDAREAYNECARNATKGPKSECLVMGGRK